jgi:hypothetical protein
MCYRIRSRWFQSPNKTLQEPVPGQ